MENAGLRFQVDVLHEDGSMAQQLVFDQRGLNQALLLELQQKAVFPLVSTLTELMARLNQAAVAKVVGNVSASPVSTPKA